MPSLPRLPRPRAFRASAFLAVLMLAPALLGLPGIASAAPTPLPVPPTGGLTQGLAGSSDPVAVAAAQAFEVQAVWMLDSARQRWLVHVPGAPDSVNTLTSDELRADSIVTLRRPGDLPPRSSLILERREPTDPDGEPNALAQPPAGGLVQGVSGTNDPATLAEAQPFAVQTVWVLDVASQQWLAYVPGAPASINTLDRSVLHAGSIVTLRRTPTTPATAPTTPAVEYAREAEARLVQLVNQARTQHGLPPLEVDTRLRDVARLHSIDMRDRDYFAHENPDGLDPFDRMKAGGITYRWAGENLARAASAERAHELLMDSPGHRKNILNEHFRRIGIGAVETPRGILFTQLFTD